MKFRDNLLHSESCYIQWNHPFCSISKIGGALAFSVDPLKNLIISMQLVFFTVDRKFSQTKAFSQKVFFMFCLEHFSLKCIIKDVELKVNKLKVY